MGFYLAAVFTSETRALAASPLGSPTDPKLGLRLHQPEAPPSPALTLRLIAIHTAQSLRGYLVTGSDFQTFSFK